MHSKDLTIITDHLTPLQRDTATTAMLGQAQQYTEWAWWDIQLVNRELGITLTTEDEIRAKRVLLVKKLKHIIEKAI